MTAERQQNLLPLNQQQSVLIREMEDIFGYITNCVPLNATPERRFRDKFITDLE